MEANRPRRVARWPLFLIATPAAVAVWSGWVGLGALCGFGIIHPLPGIWDTLRLNTAITLPVGVEAYGAYALGAWLTPGTSGRARTFARWSAIGSLGLGMAGQVIYHLLAAAHATRAPWPVVTLVSCLPVVALAFGAALAHLLHDEGTESETTQEVRATVSVADAPAPASAPARAPEPEPASAPDTDTTQDEPASETVPSASRIGMTLEEAAREFAAEVAAGERPSLRQIQRRCRTGMPRAKQIRMHLTALVDARMLAPVGARMDAQARMREPVSL